MNSATVIATLTAVGAAATLGSGTAAALPVPDLPAPRITLSDNSVLYELPTTVTNPLGAFEYRLDSNPYVVTLTNRSTDAACGVAVTARRVVFDAPHFPPAWTPERSGWSSHPDAVPPGQSRTFTIDISDPLVNLIVVTAGCGSGSEPEDTRVIFRTNTLPGLGSVGSGSSLRDENEGVPVDR